MGLTSGLEIAADDWGFSKGINDGILNLAQRGIVHSVSLLATAPLLTYRLTELQQIPNIKLAWHVNFTAGPPLEKSSNSSLVQKESQHFYPFKTFFWRWCTGKIIAEDLLCEARAQIELLKQVTNKVVEADGHHHVHLVPGILSRLQPIYQEFGIESIRLPMEKSHLASYAGSKLIWWRRNNFPNLSLREFGYPQFRHFADRESFLRASRNRPVLVHPAAYDDFAGNPYQDMLCAERVRQYEKLNAWFV